MTREPLESLLTAKPFLPFRIHMTGRTVYDIRDPAHVEVRDSVVEITRPDPSAPGGKTWQCTLALMHIVSIELPCCDEPTIVTPERSAQ